LQTFPYSFRKSGLFVGLVVVFVELVVGCASHSKVTIRDHQENLPPGLVALWSGEGNANSSVGDGMLAGNITYGQGRIGQAFVFDGKWKDSVKVGNPVQLQLQDFTIAAWIKRNNTHSVSADFRNGVIFGYGVGGYALYLNSKGVPALSKLNVHDGETRARTKIKDTKWHHLVVAKSGNTVVFYVDGVAYPAPAYDSKFVFSTGAAIGAAGDNSGDNFLGRIDEVGIYNRALSSSEVQSIYTEQK
jgi:hypothetical protein